MKRFLFTGEWCAFFKLKINPYIANTYLYRESAVALQPGRLTTRATAFFLCFICLFTQIAHADVPVSARPISGADVSAETSQVPSFTLQQQNVLTGTVVDQDGQPLEGVTVAVRGTAVTTSTDADGRFTLRSSTANGVLAVSFLGYEPITQRFDAENPGPFHFTLIPLDSRLEEVEVSTGYQQLQKKHLTGSVDFVDNELFNRRVGASVLERLENVTTGLAYDAPGETVFRVNPHGILIRGRNSIHADVGPLVVVDNFPYDGDIENLNPNDVEDITILKDAAAAAQWGARAGNGVIVITTKRGRTTAPSISINANTTFQGRPDIYAISRISTKDFIELERLHFENGFYNSALNATVTPPPLTPVVELLARERAGEVDSDFVEAQIRQWEQIDVRDEFLRYFYQPALRQQYSFNVSGSAPVVNYYLSAGYDKNKANLVGNNDNRLTLRTNNTFHVVKGLDIEAGMTYTQFNRHYSGNTGVRTRSGNKEIYPYAQLVDADGRALPIANTYRLSYIDNLGEDRLLDWKFYPYGELSANDNNHNQRDFLLTTAVNYSFFDHFRASARYQFQNNLGNNDNLRTLDAYDVRDQINSLFQPGAAVEWPVPHGGILAKTTTETISNQGRIQLDYHQTFQNKHRLRAFVGWEIKETVNTRFSHRLYGYDRNGSQVASSMDFATRHPRYLNPRSLGIINDSKTLNETVDRFISSYLNVHYTYDERYNLSASLREDAANLFGVATNQRGVPLWSTGVSWNFHNENFFRSVPLDLLRLRATYGHSGNFSREASAYMTISYAMHLSTPIARIANPPNEDLRWEQNRQFNVGLDVGAWRNRLNATIEYYEKRNIDLMAQAPVDPTLGILSGSSSFFYGNVASTEGWGMDARLDMRLVDRPFHWDINVRFSHTDIVVSEYLMTPPTTASFYINDVAINPIVGKPVRRMFSHRWAGLDPETGDPRGYLDGEISKNYTQILNNTPPDSLVYHGPRQAPYFGGIGTSLRWRRFSASLNAGYSWGHYLRMNSVDLRPIADTWSGHGDYALRWQQPGDEAHTNVPSFVYGSPTQRDNLYRNSEILVASAAYFAIQDIRVDYDVSVMVRSPFRNIRVYAYLSDLNWYWAANPKGINPRIGENPVPAIRFSMGLNIGI